MPEGLAVRVRAGDAVRVHYHPPGQVISFVEGVVSRVNLTTTRGPGFLIDITRDVFLGREQPVRPGYQHYVLYESLEDVSAQVEVLSQARGEPASHSDHVSEPKVEQQPEAEREDAPEQGPNPVAKAEQETNQETTSDLSAEVDRSHVEVEREDGPKWGVLIASIFRRRR